MASFFPGITKDSKMPPVKGFAGRYRQNSGCNSLIHVETWAVSFIMSSPYRGYQENWQELARGGCEDSQSFFFL